MGCDKDHNFEPPCRNNIVDGSPAVWDALGLNKDDGQAQITWSDERACKYTDQHVSPCCQYIQVVGYTE